MPIATDCPLPQELQAFLLGECLPAEVDRVAAHREQCTQCFGSLDRLPANDPLLEAMQSPPHRATMRWRPCSWT